MFPPSPKAAAALICLTVFVPTPQVRGKSAGPGAPPKLNALPPAPPLPPSAGLPLGWSEGKDPASGATYYFNASTKQTQWAKPASQV